MPTIETRPNRRGQAATGLAEPADGLPAGRPAPRPAVLEPLTLAAVGLTGYGVVFLTNVLLSRSMGTDVYGDYSVAFAVLGVATSLTLVGSDQAASRFIPSLAKAGDRTGLHDYIVWNLRWLARPFLLVVALAAVALFASLATDALGLIAFGQYHLAVHAVWIAPLSAAALLFGSYFVALGRSVLGGIYRNFLANALILGFVAAAIWLLDLPIDQGAVILAVWALSFVSVLAVQLWALGRQEPDVLQEIRSAFAGPPGAVDRNWASTSRWMLAITISGIVLWHLDLLVVEIVSPSEAATGHYAAIVLIARMLHLVPLYIGFMVKPKVGYAFDKPEEHKALQRAIDGSNAIVAAVSVAMLTGMIVWRDDILGLFGPGFRDADVALIVLASGVFAGGLARQARSILMASGGERIVSRTAAGGLAIVVVVGAPAVHLFGLDGMAAVSGAVVAGQNLIFCFFAKRRIEGIRPLTVV